MNDIGVGIRNARSFARLVEKMRNRLASKDVSGARAAAQRAHACRARVTDDLICMIGAEELDRYFAEHGPRLYDPPHAKAMHHLRRIGYEGGRYDLSAEEARVYIREIRRAESRSAARSAVLGRCRRMGSVSLPEVTTHPRSAVVDAIHDLVLEGELIECGGGRYCLAEDA